MTLHQKEIYEKVKAFVLERPDGLRLSFPATIPAKDKAFVLKLSKDLGISHTIEISEDESLQTLICLDLESEDEDSDEESSDARQRVFKRYDKMNIIQEEQSLVDEEKRKRCAMDKLFLDWKTSYYKVRFLLFFESTSSLTVAFLT
jgi:5'-3' exonuclease